VVDGAQTSQPENFAKGPDTLQADSSGKHSSGTPGTLQGSEKFAKGPVTLQGSAPSTCYFPIRSFPHIRMIYDLIYGYFLRVLPMRRKPGISDKTSTLIHIWGRCLVLGQRPRDGRSY